MDVIEFWRYVLEQDADRLREFFCEDAYVNWHCTNEHFNVNEYIRANCEYPGEWTGELERTEKAGDMIVTAVHVYPKDRSWSLHVTSFFKLENSKIKSIDEYWAEDGEAPEWRKSLKVKLSNNLLVAVL